MCGCSSRRSFLAGAIMLTPAVAMPGLAFGALAEPRRLRFLHTHTSEKLDVVYSENGSYIADALDEINHLLRDFRSGHVHPIDPGLLDILHGLRQATGNHQRFEIISAFRSPVTNEMLRRTGGGGVAQRSLHMDGMAIDIRLPGTPLAKLRDAALAMRRGGVGFYPGDNFIHVDTGRPRSW